MSTTRRRCEPGDDEKGPYWLNDPFWSRFNKVQGTAQRAELRRETEPSKLLSRPTARRKSFDAVWQRYCDVIRELEMTAAELDAMRKRRE